MPLILVAWPAMATPSLRERKKAATRRQLMDVALRLFDERGFENTTVEEIAAAAEVAPRTFFRYFATKVDVLFGDHDELVELLRETLAARPSSEPVVDAVRRATLEGISQVIANPPLFLTRSRLAASIPAAHARSRYLDADYEDVIAEALAGVRGTDPASDLQARLVNEAFDLLNRGFRRDQAERMDEP